MDWKRETVLGVARWCVLAWHGPDGPRVAPHAFWSDGARVWLAPLAGAPEAEQLRARPGCALWVPPVEPGTPGVAVAGTARVFGSDDPLGLVVHGPLLSTALLALAARAPRLLFGEARALAALPPRLPRNRVVVRVTVERLRGADLPAPPQGMAPALPPAIPADLRRRHSGVHDAALAVAADGELRVGPVALGGGFRLSTAEPLPEGRPAALALVSCGGDQELPEAGIAFEGVLRAGPALEVGQARWWIGGREGVAAVSGAGGLVLPD